MEYVILGGLIGLLVLNLVGIVVIIKKLIEVYEEEERVKRDIAFLNVDSSFNKMATVPPKTIIEEE